MEELHHMCLQLPIRVGAIFLKRQNWHSDSLSSAWLCWCCVCVKELFVLSVGRQGQGHKQVLMGVAPQCLLHSPTPRHPQVGTPQATLGSVNRTHALDSPTPAYVVTSMFASDSDSVLDSTVHFCYECKEKLVNIWDGLFIYMQLFYPT